MADSKDLQDDQRFANVPSAGEPVQLNDSGVAKVEDLGDGLVKVTDRDGRVSVLPLDVEPTNLSDEQKQQAIDVAVENSPGDPELNPAHSSFDPNKPAFEIPAEENSNVKPVNAGLGVDKQNDNASK